MGAEFESGNRLNSPTRPERASMHHSSLVTPHPPLPASRIPLEIHNATIRFGTFTAVDRVSLSVAAGEVFGLMGPNGSGKTTLIRAVCGLIPLAEGTARVLERDVALDAENIRAEKRYRTGHRAR